MKTWTDKDIDFLIKNYSDNSNDDLSKSLNKTTSAINAKSLRLNLKKSNEYLKKINKERIDNKWKYENKDWKKDELEFIIQNKNLSNKELSKELNKSITAISNLRKRLSLTIDKPYTINSAIDECKNYSTKQELRLLNPNLYAWLYKKNIMKEASAHMLKITYSMPQLILKYIFEKITKLECVYNDRKTIYPYELDIYYPNYRFAIEYDGSYFHQEENNKIGIAKKNNIHLIKINDEKIAKKNFDNYEINIKNNLIKNISIINEIFGLNITEQEILNIEINKNELFSNIKSLNIAKDICKKYTIYSDFTKNEKKIYSMLYNRGLLKDYTSHMTK